jgi:LysM repeat protein
MAIAHPDEIGTLLVDGVDLGDTAPETIEGGTKVALKVWYFKRGTNPVVQRGRVTPEPVRFSFKLTGPDALDNALYLDGLSKTKEEPVQIVWGRINFTAVIGQVTYQAQRTEVSVTMELTPVKDPNPSGGVFIPQVEISPFDLLAELADGLGGILALVDQAGKFFDNAFQSLRDAIDTATDVVAKVDTALATVTRIVDLPAQTVTVLSADLSDASSRLQNGAADLVAAANGAVDLPADITAGVTQVASTCTISSERMDYLVQQMAPTVLIIRFKEGDTLSGIAEAYGLSVDAILAVNPGFASSPPTPGTEVKVPSASG